MSENKEDRCPGCGRKYQSKGRAICYICEECPSCCACEVPVTLTLEKFKIETEKGWLK